MKFKTEADVARPVVAWLEEQHWDVYQEVQFINYGKVADIVAVRHKLLWVIEVKKSLTLSVLDQAYRWATPLRSIAVPKAKKQRDVAERLARAYFKVGIIEVGKSSNYSLGVYEKQPAPLLRGNYPTTRMLSKLTEKHKHYAEAGSNKRNHLTPYKNTMDDVKYFITKNPGCAIKDIYEDLGKCHYASQASMKSSIQTSLDKYEDWCLIDKTERPWKFSITKG